MSVIWVFRLIIFPLLFIFLLFRGAFVSQDVAVRAVEALGFSDIQVTDHSWFAVGMRGCDGKDAARFTVQAKNTTGKKVGVYVCSGLVFKGATVRTR